MVQIIPLRKYLKTFAGAAAGEYLSKAFGFITTMYLARILTAEDFGALGFSSALASYAVLIANFGLDQYAAQSISSGRTENAKQITRDIFIIRSILSVLTFIPCILFGMYSSYSVQYQWLFILQAFVISAYALNPQFYYTAVDRLRVFSIQRITVAGLSFAAVFLVIRDRNDIAFIPMLTGSITFVVFLLAALSIYRKEKNEIAALKSIKMLSILKGALPLGISSLMIQIYYSADMIFLGIMQPGTDTGLYAAAYRVILIFTAVPGLFYMVFLPHLSTITEEYFRNIHTRTYILLQIFTGCILTVVLYIWSEEVIALILGATFLPAVKVFRILDINLFLVFVNVAVGNLLIAWNRQKEYLIVVSAGAFVNILLNVALIPEMGIYGAAYATVGAEIGVLLFTIYYHLREIRKSVMKVKQREI
ncbi:MAG: flippase [Bacteroidota bacterium]